MASINLTWAASAGATSGIYRIKYWRTTTPDLVQVIEPVQATAYTLTGLVDNVVYNGTIESRCTDGSYSGSINWSVNTTPVSSGGGGTITLTSSINGSAVANCSYGASGTITIASGESKKVRVATTYYSGGGTQYGATLSVKDSITNAVIFSMTSPSTTLYQEFVGLSTNILSSGTYNYDLSPVNCFGGSGQTIISLVNP